MCDELSVLRARVAATPPRLGSVAPVRSSRARAAPQEDGAELAVALKRALAGRSLAEAPDADIAAALRDFERLRSARCGALIAQARTTGRRNVPARTWLVRPLPRFPGSGERAPRWLDPGLARARCRSAVAGVCRSCSGLNVWLTHSAVLALALLMPWRACSGRSCVTT